MLLQIATHQPRMLWSIIEGTPHWVWALLAALLWLGASQMLPRQVGLRRTLLAPLALTAFSAWGLGTAFGLKPGLLLAWLAASGATALVALALRAQAPDGLRFDAATLRFHLPGSAVPMLLILAIFMTKYIVGVELALQPPLAADHGFALDIALLYGLFNGLLFARVVRLWRLVQRTRMALA